jgi:hypothetical protein
MAYWFRWQVGVVNPDVFIGVFPSGIVGQTRTTAFATIRHPSS